MGFGWVEGGGSNAPTPSSQDSPYITQTRLVSPKGHKRVKLKRKDESSAVIKKKNVRKGRISGYSS